MKKKSVLLASLMAIPFSAMAKVNMSIEPEAIEGEYLVKLKESHAKSILNLKSNDMFVKQNFELGIGNIYLVKSNLKSAVTLDYLKSLDEVEVAEPNFIYKAIQTENKYRDLQTLLTRDPKFDDLWGLVNTGSNEPSGSRGNSSASGVAGADINARDAWTITKGSDQVTIAVIDTGVDYTHEDLRANNWINTAEANGRPGVDDDGNGYVDDIHGYDFANDDGDPMDDNAHGTHCAGTIAAEHDNGKGIAGVMANAKIMGVKFLTGQGSGSSANAIRSIDYATKMNVDIMSNSWGGGGFSQLMKEAVERAEAKGIVFTAAAGNSASDNDTSPHYPSNYEVDNVISVAAHNYNDRLASFSCYGKNTVHVAAPGRNILSTTPNNGYEVFSGTSMATPHVTGVVGLYIAHHGRENVKVLREKLMKSSVYARAYRRTTASMGRVDAFNFLTGVTAHRPSMPNESEWRNEAITPIATAHPYPDNHNQVDRITIPGAKFLRVVISKYDLETRYDNLRIKDANGDLLETVTGNGTNYTTDFVEGDTVILDFQSDGSVNKWGYEVSEVQVIY